MLQFTQQEIINLKEKVKSHGYVIEKLKEEIKPVETYGVKVPKDIMATVTLDYVCHKDSATLIYEYGDSKNFVCPICGSNYKEDAAVAGSWWRYTNGVTTHAAYCSGLLWMLTEEEKYRSLCQEILTTFAERYPSYTIHGGVPYNNPGRMNSQSLCEALCIRSLALAFDLIRDTLPAKLEQQMIDDLFIPSCEVLKEYRVDQIHNHECIVNSGLGIAGLVIGREDFVDYAVNSRYGFRYHLQEALTEDGFWFESTVHYHYFALDAFLLFERVAKGTEFSMLENPGYEKMLRMPLNLFLADWKLPSPGDGGAYRFFEQLAEYYEMPYQYYGDKKFAQVLNKIYEDHPRDSLEAFLYGADFIEPTPPLKLENYHDDEGSGFTVLHGNKQQSLVFRHGRYGGEHDHYDKLGIAYMYGGVEILADQGTVSYSAPLHYNYFKTTATHNTVSINGENQPPCNGRTVAYRQMDNGVYVEAKAKWTDIVTPINSYVIPQWSQESYVNVQMNRGLLFTDDYILEAFWVRGAAGRSVDYGIHGSSRCTPATGTLLDGITLGDARPFSFMHDVKAIKPSNIATTRWDYDHCSCFVHSFCSRPMTMIYAKGPTTPVPNEIVYLYNRVTDADDILFANIIEANSGAESAIKNITISCDEVGKVTYSFAFNGQPRKYCLALNRE